MGDASTNTYKILKCANKMHINQLLYWMLFNYHFSLHNCSKDALAYINALKMFSIKRHIPNRGRQAVDCCFKPDQRLSNSSREKSTIYIEKLGNTASSSWWTKLCSSSMQLKIRNKSTSAFFSPSSMAISKGEFLVQSLM